MDNAGDLRALLASHHPLLFVQMRDERRFLRILRAEAAQLGLAVWTWSAARGLVRDGQRPQATTQEAGKALSFLQDAQPPAVFVFCDAHHALTDPAVVRRVKEFALEPYQGRTIVLTSTQSRMPTELRGLALPWTLKPPAPEELEALVRRTLDDLKARKIPVLVDDAGIERLTSSLRGLSTLEAEHLIQRVALDGRVDDEDVERVMREKATLFGTDTVLELVEADVGTLDDVGGLEGLKSWLRLRGRAMEPAAREFGLDPPRGVLITGVPGCGKSFLAKTLARTWGLPLLLLDPARMFGPYVGESEQRLRSTLEAAESMAPAVLWIDEIEKGFSTSGRGDSGVSDRMRGTFLRWMQERPEGIFIAATSNDVNALPPEFARKGRFDEIFFVDLPTSAERAQILRLHIARRGRDPETFDIDTLVAASDGFSGAEIETAIVAALYRAYADEGELTTEAVIAEFAGTVPLSRSRAEEVAMLRAWASDRAVPAT